MIPNLTHQPNPLPPPPPPGGGEVDVKLGVSAAEFVRAYADQPVLVVDCTYDDDGGDGGGGENGGDDAPPCGG